MTGKVLEKLWKTLKTKFLAVRSEIIYHKPGSGSGITEKNAEDWRYYQNMRFLEKFVQPREIISSNKLRDATSSLITHQERRPEAEEFTKKKQATKDKYEQEYQETNKLFAKAVDFLTKPVTTGAPESELGKKKYNVYCQAVITSFQGLKEEHKFEGFYLIMSEIKKMKI